MSRTPSKEETAFPGWWPQLVSEVIVQLPRPGDGQGEITKDIADGWLKNGGALKKALSEALLPSEPSPTPNRKKFALLEDLGVITIPDDYVHATRIKDFMKKNQSKFYSVNKNITDENFKKPSCILKPGDKLHVRVFHQVDSGKTTSKERMEYLEQQNAAIYVGVQGASIVLEQKRDLLPKSMYCASYDHLSRLPEIENNRVFTSVVDVDSDGDFHFCLFDFNLVMDWDHAFLGFSEHVSSVKK
ncbi:MAG: hypothetical protein WC045_02600 [Patescibacteria group bacterium]